MRIIETILCILTHRGAPAIVIASLLIVAAANAQQIESQWSSAFSEPPLASQFLNTAQPLAGCPADLDRLSDEELLDLYVATYEQSLRAQVADRAALVDAGRFLLQFGYTFSSHHRDDLRNTTHTVPELMLRYRLLKRLEVRVAWAGVTLDRLSDDVSGTGDWETRLSDPSVGGRLALVSQRGWLPRTSLTVSSPLNVDSNVELIDRLDPFVGLGYSWQIGESWLLSATSAMVWSREGDHRFLDFQQTVSVDWFAEERWGAFVEWSSLFPEGARVDGASHILGPGISYSLTRDLQLDLVVMFGLDDASPDVLTQVLLSWRF
jgi:hypothetical protein